MFRANGVFFVKKNSGSFNISMLSISGETLVGKTSVVKHESTGLCKCEYISCKLFQLNSTRDWRSYETKYALETVSQHVEIIASKISVSSKYMLNYVIQLICANYSYFQHTCPVKCNSQIHGIYEYLCLKLLN